MSAVTSCEMRMFKLWLFFLCPRLGVLLPCGGIFRRVCGEKKRFSLSE